MIHSFCVILRQKKKWWKHSRITFCVVSIIDPESVLVFQVLWVLSFTYKIQRQCWNGFHELNGYRSTVMRDVIYIRFTSPSLLLILIGLCPITSTYLLSYDNDVQESAFGGLPKGLFVFGFPFYAIYGSSLSSGCYLLLFPVRMWGLVVMLFCRSCQDSVTKTARHSCCFIYIDCHSAHRSGATDACVEEAARRRRLKW